MTVESNDADAYILTLRSRSFEDLDTMSVFHAVESETSCEYGHSEMPAQLGGAPNCPRCSQRVYFNEEKTFMSRSWHKKCFTCDDCGKQLESTNASQAEDEGQSIYCSTCYRKLTNPKTTPPTSPAYVNFDDTECCPRCGTKVYFAEQMLSLGRKWHNQCFTCSECKKHLVPTLVADHRGELFCKPCYRRKFGPKGYGYAGGAGNGLSMDAAENSESSNVPHTAQAYLAPGEEGGAAANETSTMEGAEFCPRCGKQVFIAEKKQAGGKAYHDRCFRCEDCQKKLDLGGLSENTGKIYCKTCYSKNFGPTGYGFGVSAGSLKAL